MCLVFPKVQGVSRPPFSLLELFFWSVRHSRYIPGVSFSHRLKRERPLEPSGPGLLVSSFSPFFYWPHSLFSPGSRRFLLTEACFQQIARTRFIFSPCGHLLSLPAAFPFFFLFPYAVWTGRSLLHLIPLFSFSSLCLIWTSEYRARTDRITTPALAKSSAPFPPSAFSQSSFLFLPLPSGPPPRSGSRTTGTRENILGLDLAHETRM